MIRGLVEEESGVNAYFPGYEDIAFIGLSLRDIGDDETKRQFKERIEGLISPLFEGEIEFKEYERSWND